MRKHWVIALPVVTAVLALCILVAWFFYPSAMQITVSFSSPPAYVHDAALSYLDASAAEIAIADEIWLRAELVQASADSAPQLLFFLDYSGQHHEALALDIAHRLLDSPDRTATQSYITYLNGQLLICLDAAAAPGYTPQDTLNTPFVYVDEAALVPGVTTCLEHVDGEYRSLPLGGKYFLALTWVPENYCLTFGDYELTGAEIQAALLLTPYGYRTQEG